MQIKGGKIHPALLAIGGVVLVALLVASLGLILNPASTSEQGAGGSTESSPISSGYYWDLEDILVLLLYSPFAWIIAIGVVGVIGIGLYFLIRRRHVGEKERGGLIKHISPISALLALILTFGLVVLFSKIWLDLADVVSVGERPRAVPEHLAALFAHTLFVAAVLVIAFMLYFVMRERRQQFTVIVAPYFVASVIFAGWLLLDAGVFAFSSLGSFGIYAVLFFVILLFSVLLYFSQDWEHKRRLAAEDDLLEESQQDQQDAPFSGQ